VKTTITVFMNPSCGPCHRLIKWLKDEKIEFIEKDIVNDPAASKEFAEIDGRYTPTTIIQNGEEQAEVIGANPPEIEKALSEIG